MKKHTLIFTAVAAAIVSASAAKTIKDPVVMKVNGKEIHRSEFEYLYNKNNTQQLSPQTFDEYVDMFAVYKMKVAEAEAEGLDKTDNFKKEFDGYCKDLAKPYMKDSLVEERLINEAYKRMGTTRLVSHIMLPMGTNYDERNHNRELLDSIRTEVLAGRADFSDMARKFSTDPSVENNGGSMGYIAVNRFPYPFEKAAWDTPVGQISEVVNDTPYGFHIIRVEDEKPNPGRVEARHILKLTRGLSEEQIAVKKAQIDSIYDLLINGGNFSEIAVKESEDPGSAIAGGKLGAFGPGQMVKEFEDTAFGLNDGEISKPFPTIYGFHIVQTLAHKDMETFEEAHDALKMAIGRDMRSRFPERELMNKFREDYGIKVDTATLLSFKDRMDAAPSSKEAFDLIASDTTPVATVGKKPVTIAEVVAYIPENTREGEQDPFSTLYQEIFNYMDGASQDAFRQNLYETNTDYRNLVDEYRDGILLFEISDKNVWDRSQKDTEGLENFFKTNREKYAWKKPHYKGYVIFATSDSIADAARRYLAENNVAPDSLSIKMRENFGRINIKVERVVTGQGDNAIVDNVAFGGEKPSAPGKWIAWFGYDGQILNAPEEAADVKGAVTTDYQQELEKQWVASLRNKYKVKLNKKALNDVKNSNAK